MRACEAPAWPCQLQPNPSKQTTQNTRPSTSYHIRATAQQPWAQQQPEPPVSRTPTSGPFVSFALVGAGGRRAAIRLLQCIHPAVQAMRAFKQSAATGNDGASPPIVACLVLASVPVSSCPVHDAVQAESIEMSVTTRPGSSEPKSHVVQTANLAEAMQLTSRCDPERYPRGLASWPCTPPSWGGICSCASPQSSTPRRVSSNRVEGDRRGCGPWSTRRAVVAGSGARGMWTGCSFARVADGIPRLVDTISPRMRHRSTC